MRNEERREWVELGGESGGGEAVMEGRGEDGLMEILDLIRHQIQTTAQDTKLHPPPPTLNSRSFLIICVWLSHLCP